MTLDRLGWVDWVKAMAIFAVVLLHTHCDAVVYDVTNVVAMPTFFFVSGFLFDHERNPLLGRFAYKRFRQLVVPYLWIGVLSYVAWLLVLRHYGADADGAMPWHRPVVGMLCGVPEWLVHDVPLWSLLCFFVVEMAFYVLHCLCGVGRGLLALCCGVGAVAVSCLMPSDGWLWPLTGAPLCAGMFFYSLGNLMRGHISVLTRVRMLVLQAGLVGVVITVLFNGSSAMYRGWLGQYPVLYLAGGCAAVVVMLQLGTLLTRALGDVRVVRFVSTSTLLICGFHLLFFAAIKGFVLLVLHRDPAVLSNGVLAGVAYVCMAFVLCLPVAWVVERYFPWLVYKR